MIKWIPASEPPSDDRLIWLQHHEGNSLNTLPDLMACQYINGRHPIPEPYVKECV